jgi:hypothetical protein
MEAMYSESSLTYLEDHEIRNTPTFRLLFSHPLSRTDYLYLRACFKVISVIV